MLVNLNDVTARPVEWLWPGRIAIGKLTLIAGDPGLGKSFLTLDMIARISTGTPWPDARTQPNPMGSAILMSAEDDLEDTIRPRLDSAGADVSRITAIQGVNYYDPDTQRGTVKSFNLEVDLPALESAIRKATDCRLVIVDPISAYCGRVDGHKNTDVRALLAPLARLAADHRVAVVAVSHLNKGSGANALYRAMGSLAFVAAARAVWLVTKDAETPGRRLFLPAKNNLGPDEGTGLAYSLAVDDGAAIPAVRWEAEPVTMTAAEALGNPAANTDEGSAVDDAVGWLREQLRDGPMPSKSLKEAAKADGLSWRTIERGRTRLNIVTGPDGFGGPWTWSLPNYHRPQSPPTNPESATPQSVAETGESGGLCSEGVPF